MAAVLAAGCGQMKPGAPSPAAAASADSNTSSVTNVAVFGTAPAIGQTAQFTANVELADGTGQNVTTQAVWSSSNSAFATVSPSGVVTGVTTGNVTISATYQGKTGNLGIVIPAVSPVPPTPPPPAGSLISCSHVRDDASTLTRQLYWPSFTGTTVTEVDVYLTSKGKAVETYTATLIVTANGTSYPSDPATVIVNLPERGVSTAFTFSQKLSIANGSAVRMKVEQKSGPGELFWEGQTDAACAVLTVDGDKSTTQIVGPKIPVRIAGF